MNFRFGIRALRLKLALLVLSMIVAVLPLRAEGPDMVEKSVDKAMKYLLGRQQKNGSIHDNKYKTATTALSVMALAAAGHMPDDPTPEGKAMKKAIDYVVHEDRYHNGNYAGGRDGSRMYGHGIITLMLAEMVGMGNDEKQDALIRQRLEKCVELILWAQKRKQPKNWSHYGGWRYEPHSGDSDLSVTVWQLIALRAAKNAGIDIPKKAIDDAVKYVKRCYHSKRDKDGRPTNLKTGCGYQPGRGPSYASGAAGLLALQICGEYDAPEVLGSANWLLGRKLHSKEKHFFYGTYYYAQGMYQKGGDYAKKAKRDVESILRKNQRRDGSWHSRNGNVYATSMAVLSLSVQYHYLPIYQR